MEVIENSELNEPSTKTEQINNAETDSPKQTEQTNEAETDSPEQTKEANIAETAIENKNNLNQEIYENEPESSTNENTNLTEKETNSDENLNIENENKGDSETEQKKERSKFSLEGAKEPLSLFTRRIMDISNIKNYLNSDSTAGLCGGRNLGNTCFMNSSIACISNCTELTYYFLCGDYEKDLNEENNYGMNGRLAKSWAELLKEYWVENTNIGDPRDFKNTIGEKAVRFRGYGQQDSNEFMSIFLDYLNEDLNAVTKKPYIELCEKKDNENDEECSKRFWDSNLMRNDSIITDLFCGQFKSTVTCNECGNINITFEPFYSINLPIKNRKKKSNFFTFCEYLKEYTVTYVPKYAIRDSVSVTFNHILKSTTFEEILSKLKECDDFKYKEKINKLNYIHVKKEEEDAKYWEYDDTVEPENVIGNNKSESVLLYDQIDEDDENIKIPIYVLYEEGNGGNVSKYPRMIFGKNEMTFEELRKKIYYNIRKYLYSPLKQENEESDTLTDQILKYNEDFNMDENELLSKIDEEYNLLFSDIDKIEDENTKTALENYIKNIPFKLRLREKNGFTVINILNENKINELSSEIIEKSNIKDVNCSIAESRDDLEDFVITVEFDINSKYLNKNNLDFNKCSEIEIKCEDKKDNEEEKKEEEEDKQTTLYDCINKFCEEEKLKEGNEWFCNKCKKLVLPKKKMELYYLPKLLIICFKRFVKESYRWEKNEEDIDFPIDNMDMKDYVIGPDKDHSIYDLFAVSQHYGCTGFGHYTAVCKNAGNWYSYDDSSCSPTSARSALTSAAYVLFYRRQTD